MVNKTPSLKKNTAGKSIFLTAFFLFCVKYTFDSSAIFIKNDIFDSLLVIAVIILLCIKFITQRFTIQKIITAAVMIITVAVSCYLGKYFLLLFATLFIFNMQDVDLTDVIRLSYRFKIASLIIHVTVYILTYIADPESIDYVYRIGGAPRHYFFMGHANLFMAFLAWTCFEYIFLNYKKIRPLHIMAIWMINMIFYAFTDSNTGMVILAAFTLIIIFEKSGAKSVDRVLTILAKYIYSFVALLFTLLATVYTRFGPTLKNVWHALDNALTGRLKYGAYVYDVFGVTFMGRRLTIPEKIFWDGRWFDRFFYFDNFYHGNLLQFGIIHIIITAVVFAIIANKLENSEKIIIIIFSLYGIMEAYVINVFICFALLIIGKYFYRENKKPAGDAPQPDDIYASG